MKDPTVRIIVFTGLLMTTIALIGTTGLFAYMLYTGYWNQWVLNIWLMNLLLMVAYMVIPIMEGE